MTSMNTSGRSLLRHDAAILQGPSAPRSRLTLPGARWLAGARHIQPGLVLAWSVMAVVMLWALFPQWFTGYSGTVGVARQ